jgi:hypothetical protein
VTIETEAQEALRRHRHVWEQKPILRRIFSEEIFALLAFSKSGRRGRAQK